LSDEKSNHSFALFKKSNEKSDRFFALSKRAKKQKLAKNEQFSKWLIFCSKKRAIAHFQKERMPNPSKKQQIHNEVGLQGEWTRAGPVAFPKTREKGIQK